MRQVTTLIPPATIEKISKLVPMLGSDQDNEVLAAVRMIGRKLEADGFSFHEIVPTLLGGRPVPKPAPFATQSPGKSFFDEVMERTTQRRENRATAKANDPWADAKVHAFQQSPSGVKLKPAGVKLAIDEVEKRSAEHQTDYVFPAEISFLKGLRGAMTDCSDTYFRMRMVDVLKLREICERFGVEVPNYGY